MYHSHYNLSGAPFQFTPTPSALYLSKGHREGLAVLEWSLLHEPTGFTVLVGESGVGKTTLVCSILARGYANVRSAYINNPKLHFEQMMQALMVQLLRPAPGQSGFQMIESFTGMLRELAPGERVAIIIDEAQDLDNETLENIRLLSNQDTAAERRLQIILVGQPELIDHLASPKMVSLNQRIGARVLLGPLETGEAREYIDCRLRLKGGSARKIFAPTALQHLVRHGRGIPRRLNVLCHNAMLLGYVGGHKRVTLAMARSAVNEFDNLLGSRPSGREEPARALRPRPFARAALAFAALILVVLGVLYVWSSQAGFALVRTHASVRGETVRPAIIPSLPGPQIPSGSLNALADVVP